MSEQTKEGVRWGLYRTREAGDFARMTDYDGLHIYIIFISNHCDIQDDRPLGSKQKPHALI